MKTRLILTVAVAADGLHAVAGGLGGTVLRSSDGGDHWTAFLTA